MGRSRETVAKRAFYVLGIVPHIVLAIQRFRNRALNVTVTLCFATQGRAGLRNLIVFCNSGLHWSALSDVVLQLRLCVASL